MPQRTPLDPSVEWVDFTTTDADWDAAEPHLLTSMLSQLVLIRTFEEFVLEPLAASLPIAACSRRTSRCS